VSSENDTCESLFVVDTPASAAVRVEPPGRVVLPTPSPTESALALPVIVHAPPVGAAPHPLATVLAKSSCARAPGVCPAVTVTCCELVSDVPSSSVTVRTTVYVPAAAYGWLLVTPVPVVPSP
jgi:hypothetical protein